MIPRRSGRIQALNETLPTFRTKNTVWIVSGIGAGLRDAVGSATQR
jgi:hypothetical protein